MATTILGISLGTRLIGIAVIRNGELIDYRVKTFKQRWSKEKQKEILGFIQTLIEYFTVQEVVVKPCNPLRASKRINQLSLELKKLLGGRKVNTHFYSLATVKLGLAIKSKNKEGLMEAITERYFELRKIYLKEINNRHSYYEKMFEAIAIAKWCSNEMEL